MRQFPTSPARLVPAVLGPSLVPEDLDFVALEPELAELALRGIWANYPLDGDDEDRDLAVAWAEAISRQLPHARS